MTVGHVHLDAVPMPFIPLRPAEAKSAMAAMRHSRIELTMNLYTDPVLPDVAGAIEALPNFAGGPSVATASEYRSARCWSHTK